MRTALLTLIAVVLSGQAASRALLAQTVPAPVVVNPQTGTVMTTYYVVLLRRGPAWTAAVTPETSAVSKGHMANIQRLTQLGKMLVAGPFLNQTGDRALAGMFILRAESAEEAKALADDDPAVKAGRFVYEIVPWMAPTTLRR